VDDSRGSDVVKDMLGSDFSGMLVSDCLSSYDPADYAKHKCIAHHLRAISKAMILPGTEDISYLSNWQLFFRAIIMLYKMRVTLAEEKFFQKCNRMEVWCDELLGSRSSQAGDVAVRNRLSKQRKYLLRCLYEPCAEPTNNRAERALHSAVIARKVSCGNKTECGRDCWQILASIGVTCQQRMTDFIEYINPCLSPAAQSS